jgi:hypothetical protein
VISSSKASTWMLTTTINTSIDYVCKGKVQKTMANSVLPLMGSSSLIVITTCSLRKLVAIIVAYTCENF